jgi:hypothetical protein
MEATMGTVEVMQVLFALVTIVSIALAWSGREIGGPKP